MYAVVKNKVLKTWDWQDGSVGKGFSPKPHDLSSIPGTHKVGENQLPQIVLWPLQQHCAPPTHPTHMHTIN